MTKKDCTVLLDAITILSDSNKISEEAYEEMFELLHEKWEEAKK